MFYYAHFTFGGSNKAAFCYVWNCPCDLLMRWRQVFQHNVPFFFSSWRVLEIVFASLLMLIWVLRSAFRYVFVMLLVRIVLNCSGVISYKIFLSCQQKKDRFSDDLMLFMLSVSFFWKPFLTGLKLIDRIISYRSLSNGDNSWCCGGVKFDFNPKFVLVTKYSFL